MAERTRHTAASRALNAAAACDSFLQAQTAAPAGGQEQWSNPPASPHDRAPAPELLQQNRPIPTGTHAGQGEPLRLAHTDWLFHELTITGPADGLAAFQDAASGAGTIPWAMHFEAAEEDWFHLMAAAPQRDISLAGARILARQLRDAAERRHAMAVARVGHSRACPFDLHTLVPVPPNVLRLGPDHPDSFGWLRQHWGTTQMLRHVAVVDGSGRHRAPPGAPAVHLNFWAADWSPWQALKRVRADWPGLMFELRPRYDAS